MEVENKWKITRPFVRWLIMIGYDDYDEDESNLDSDNLDDDDYLDTESDEDIENDADAGSNS